MTHSQTEMLLTILATSDLHGQVLPIRYVDNTPVDWGLAKLATRIRSIREDREFVMFIDNGDLLQGTPLATYHARFDTSVINPMITILNHMNCNAFVPGNHEFNYGLDFLDKVQHESNFPWLAANIVNTESGDPYFGCPYLMTSLSNGLRVALLGLTTCFIPNWEQPGHIKGLDFQSATHAAKRWVPLLREQERADVVIVAYHGGLERDLSTGAYTEHPTGENEGYQICVEVDDIDVLITGHQHRDISDMRIGKTIVVQPGSHGQYLAEVGIKLAKTEGFWHVVNTAGMLHHADGIEADHEVVDILTPYESNTQLWLDQTICEVIGDMLVHDSMQVRLSDNALIEFINRVQMDASGTHISNTALFDNSAPGFGAQVTMREVLANYPYPNTLRVLRLTGADIREALEWSARYFAPYNGKEITINPEFLHPKVQHYNYDMWEGIEYEINVSRPYGERIVSLKLDGQPLSMDDEYDVVMNHYRASCGGNYQMFKDKPIIREILTDVSELITAYMMEHVIIEAKVNYNWKVIHD